MLKPVMISALQHASYCLRQCAMIHLEQTFEENLYTLRGHRAHRKAHESGSELRGALQIERALPLFCDTLGLYGVADVVELTYSSSGELESAYPVEYKSGKRHKALHDDLQLCAQAICLESMFDLKIPEGAVFHVSSQKRRLVPLTPVLRAAVVDMTRLVRSLLCSLDRPEERAPSLPPPHADQRCQRCSLIHSCLPRAPQVYGGRSDQGKHC